MSPPVAIITGGSSGIGLALSSKLAQQGWSVIIFDLGQPKDRTTNVDFEQCDISSWDQQACAFEKVYVKHGRLDFVALNAGIDDRDDIFNTISRDPARPPKEPNMKTLDVCFTGVYYGIKIAAHYMSLDSRTAGKAKAGGKIVVTASAAGIYTNTAVPQYCGAKTGLVGLVRALAATSHTVDIRLNAICPALVATGLPPPGLMDPSRGDLITPMSTIMKAFDEVADFDNIASEKWVAEGKNGETVEANLDELIWHKAPTRTKSSVFVTKAGSDKWREVYVGRNSKFAAMDWKTEGI